MGLRGLGSQYRRLPGLDLVPHNLRLGKGHYQVFLRHRLALMDALPFVAAFYDITILGKSSLFLLGNVAAKLRRINPGFPFLRHIHHAGTVQVVVSQSGGGMHIRQMHIVVHVFGKVDDLADTIKAALGILQDGVQLCDLGGVKLAQPGGKKIQLVHVGGQHHIVRQRKTLALRVGIPVDKKILRIVGGNADLPQGCL